MDSDWSIDGDQGMSLVEKVLDLTPETGHVVCHGEQARGQLGDNCSNSAEIYRV